MQQNTTNPTGPLCARYNPAGFVDVVYPTLKDAAFICRVAEDTLSSVVNKPKLLKGSLWRTASVREDLPRRMIPFSSLGDGIKIPEEEQPVIIYRYKLDGTFSKEYESYEAAANDVAVAVTEIVRATTVGTVSRKTQWRTAEMMEFSKDPIAEFDPKAITMIRYTLEGKYVEEHASLKAAAEANGRTESSIREAASGRSRYSGDFQYRFKPLKGDILKEIPPVPPKTKTFAQPITSTNVKTKKVTKYPTLGEAISVCKTSAFILKKHVGKNTEFRGCTWVYEEPEHTRVIDK